MKEKVLNALNEQINKEIYSAYLYLSMASWFHSVGLPGFANWMELQYQEELDHAKKFYDYIVDRGDKVILQAIDTPKNEWKSTEEVIKQTLEHEQFVTESINNLIDISISEKDYMTNNLLQWFIAEQVEEEASVSEILDKLKLVSNSGNGIFMLDSEMGKRISSPE